MKRILSIIFSMLFVFLLNVSTCYSFPVTVGQSIGFLNGPGTTNGGEFIVYDWTTKENLYSSFCLETNEYLNYGVEFRVSDISSEARNGGVSGGNPDPISQETAFLFHNFYWGTLDQYDYVSDGLGTFTTRDQSANALQKAIWYFEGETGGELNYYTTLAMNAISSGLWSGLGDVAVINLVYASNGSIAQDQLTVQPVPEPATMLLLGTGLIGLTSFARKQIFKKS
jgi:hypothetical protein